MTRNNFIKAVSEVFEGFRFESAPSQSYKDEDGMTITGSENFLTYLENRICNNFYNIMSEFFIMRDEEEIYIYEIETMYSINWYKLYHLGRTFSTNMPTGTKVYEFLKRLRDAIELDIEESL